MAREIRPCFRKRPLNKAQAISRAERYSYEQAVLYSAYACRECGAWHVGKNGPRESYGVGQTTSLKRYYGRYVQGFMSVKKKRKIVSELLKNNGGEE